MKVTFLSSIAYPYANTTNYGDCIIIDSGTELVIYDCGSERHADAVLNYMRSAGYSSTKLVLSHNDNDHFAGIQKLIDAGVVSQVYTLLLFKHTEELFRILDDKRITKESLIKRISEAFDNISSLGRQVELCDTLYETSIIKGVDIVGPNKDYVLNAVAKLLDNSEGDTIDNDTISNAVSCQLKVKIGTGSLLLCGDSNYEAIRDKIGEFSAIQLPHHGKYEHACKIMEEINPTRTTLYVSDNTGDSNGGSDELMKHQSGYRIFNTKSGDKTCSSSNIRPTKRGTLGTIITK